MAAALSKITVKMTGVFNLPNSFLINRNIAIPLSFGISLRGILNIIKVNPAKSTMLKRNEGVTARTHFHAVTPPFRSDFSRNKYADGHIIPLMHCFISRHNLSAITKGNFFYVCKPMTPCAALILCRETPAKHPYKIGCGLPIIWIGNCNISSVQRSIFI